MTGEDKMENNEVNRRLSAIVDSIADGFYSLDTEFRFTHINDAALSYFKKDREEMIGKRIFDVFPGFEGSVFDTVYRRAIDSAEPAHLEAPSVVNDRTVEIHVYPGSNNLTVLFRDITERRRMEESLRTSEERFRLLHETMDVGVVFQDENGKIVSMNSAAKRILGRTEEEFLGETSVSVEHHTIRADGSPFPGLEHPAMVALRTGRKVEGVVMGVFNPLEDIYRWIEINATPLFLEGGKIPYQVYTVFSDITERKRGEQALRESEAGFRSLFENMAEGVVLHEMIYDESGTATDYRILTANPAFEKHTGLAVEKCHGQLASIFYGTGSAPYLDVFAKTADSGEPYSFETYFQPMERYFQISVSSAKQGHFVTVFENITERKLAEETLRTTVQRFHKILSNIFDGILVVTEDDRIEFANQNLCDQFDIREAPSDLIGLTAKEILQKVSPAYADPDANLARIQQILSQTHPIANEEIPMRNGRVLARDHVPILVDGKPCGRMWQHRDITEGKRAEEALQLSESRFRLLSGTAGRLLASQNPQRIVKELCLQVMEHLDCHAFFNFLVDELVGKLHLNACAGIPDEEARNIEWLDYGVAVCGCVAREGKRIVAEDIFNTPDIRTDLVKSYGIQAYACHPLEVRGKLIGTLSFGTKTRTSFSAEDLALMKTVADQVATAMEKLSLIDELRKSRDELELRVQERTAELNRYMAKLEQSNQALQDFASIASHDLQEPLRKVTAFGNMLKQKCHGSLEDHGRDYLERILNANQRMQSLLAGLLDYSRVATTAEPFKEVDLSDHIGEVLSDLEVRIVKTGGEIHVGDLPVISADPTQMRQLFQNLIGNALKFHKPGEKPMVQVRSVSKTDLECQIVVEDNGIGFDEQYLERIFAPFQRLHGRSEYEGTGMGLAICKKIVERHGGSITAKSTPGKGSLFIIDLPVRQTGL
jgi:PAS domain S-box-containing protein